jgi:type IV pilus assembly protein PilW
MNATASPPHALKSAAAGFSLIEIMVALVLGLISTVAVMQLFLASEGQKRTITGGGDAQTNGALALYSLQRDITESGYGASAYRLLGCNVLLRAGLNLSAIAPVTINHASIPAGDANTDTLLIVVGNGNGPPEGDRIQSPSESSPIYTVQTPTAFAKDDWVIAMPPHRPTPCNLELDKVNGVSPPAVSVITWWAAMTNGTLFNLGQTPSVLAYAVRGANLTLCDYMVNDCHDGAKKGDSTVWVPIVNDIVSLRAQYGRDDSASMAMDGNVDVYDRCVATPSAVAVATAQCPSPPDASTVQCGWARVSAVRIAVVARSGQYERAEVTAAAPDWSGKASTPIDLTNRADWKHYRYKVFQTVVPIRNIAWLGVQPGC